ncbi:hypothetical protein BH20VER3_BH20VER3_14790 [soil metagenome]
MPKKIGSFIVAAALVGLAHMPGPLLATSNHHYGADEYLTIVDGRSPNGKYAIATHGNGEDGYENFHVYLMNAETGKKIGPLEEIEGTLDTGADAFFARWSADSSQVKIRYRVDRRQSMEVRYRIAKQRAILLSGPTEVEALLFE